MTTASEWRNASCGMKLGWTPHHLDALGAEMISNFVAAVDIARHRRNADEICFQVKLDRLDILVSQHHLVPVARNARRDGQQARKRRIKSALEIKRQCAAQVSRDI